MSFRTAKAKQRNHVSKNKNRNYKDFEVATPSLTARERSPLTSNWAMLDTVPYLLLAVHVKHPESSENTSAMTKVQISSVCQ